MLPYECVGGCVGGKFTMPKSVVQTRSRKTHLVPTLKNTLSVLSTSQEVSRSPTSLAAVGLSSFYGPGWFLEKPGCPGNVWVEVWGEVGVVWVDKIRVGGIL